MFFANNKSPTEVLYNDRKGYEVMMPILIKDPNLYFDLWRDNYNLGRIDYKGNSIFLSESFLKPINDEHSVVFFVADSFLQLQEHWAKLIKKGLVTNIDIDPFRSYIDFHANYHDYIEEVHRDAVIYMNQDTVIRKIRDINDFMMFFLTFLEKNNFKVFNRSTFVVSNKNSIFSSGLAVDISKYKKDDNLNKVKFFQDPAIMTFMSLIRLYGFRVDINSPWTLIIDLQAPPVIKKIQEKIENPRKVFDSFYHKAYETDLEVFKVYMTQFFNAFIKKNNENKCLKISIPENGSINTLLSDEGWFTWYARFKLYEVS